ncbi:MAG: spore coat U domain-containing protein [Pseudomonadota bacterium]
MPTANLKRLIAAVILLGTSSASPALTCSANVGTLAFGNYNAVSGLPTDSQNTLTVTCSSLISILVSYTVSLSAGNSGNTAARQLRQSSNALNYNLFQDILRSNVWGTGANAVSDSYLLSILGIGVDHTYPIYGRITAGQSSVPSGSYSDTITVTVAY